MYKTGAVLEPCVKASANGYRLPTLTQWEYAARGGASGHRFPWSDTDTIQHARANYYSYWSGGHPYYAYDTSPTEARHPASEPVPFTTPVGSFAANGYGLYDMAGNLWEWCYDWSPGYEGTTRVFRGGGWNAFANNCRVASRRGGSPDYQYTTLGFRSVRPATQ